MADVRRSLGEGGLSTWRCVDYMRYVYLLRSDSHPEETYVGTTEDLPRRLAEHNAGKCRHTSRFLPWSCIVALRFLSDAKANAFERYLKTGSGRAFANRHLR
jgi:predicted GIY-YIG superfamily endonuclease